MILKPETRLRHIAELVLPRLPMADIGTDHALLPICLVKEGICPFAIASDKNPRAVTRAASAVEKASLSSLIEIRQRDGLAAVSAGEVSTCVISGLGGRAIISMLSAAPKVAASIRRLVLAPQSDIWLVRRFLADNGWRLAEERVALEDGVYYEIMAAERGFMSLTAEEARLGPLLLAGRSPLYIGFLNHRLNTVRGIIRDLEYPVEPGVKKRGFIPAGFRKDEDLLPPWIPTPNLNARRQNLIETEAMLVRALSGEGDGGF